MPRFAVSLSTLKRNVISPLKNFIVCYNDIIDSAMNKECSRKIDNRFCIKDIRVKLEGVTFIGTSRKYNS